MLKKNIIFIVATALFADYFLLSVVIPILPTIFTSYGYTKKALGILFASKPAAQIVGNLFMGSLVDSKGPKPLLLLNSFVLFGSTSMFVYGLKHVTNDVTEAYKILLVARSIQGLSSAGIMTSGMALVAKYHHEHVHGTAMGMAVTGIAAGVVLGPPLGGIMASLLGNCSPFYVILGMIFVNILLQVHFYCCSSVQNTDAVLGRNNSINASPSDIYVSSSNEGSGTITFTTIDEKESRNTSLNNTDNVSDNDTSYECCSLFKLFLFKKIAVVAFGNLLGNFCVGMMEVLIPLYLMSQFNLSQLYQGLVFGSMSFSYLFATPISGMLSDRFPKWKVFISGPIIGGSGLVLFYWATTLTLTIVCLCVTGVGVALIDTPSMSLLSAVAAGEDIKNLGNVYALQDFCVCIGFLFGPLVSSNVEDGIFGNKSSPFRYTALSCGILLLAYAPLVLILRGANEEEKETDTNSNKNVAVKEDDLESLLLSSSS
jgi:MFS transporter, DHA1 family, solute carrier family 18 (vesicular amine transporter), member 1/2